MCIDLNKHEDRKMLKEVIAEVNTPILSDIVMKLNVLKLEVDHIKKQTTETNGKVKKHEFLLSEIKKDEEIHIINHQHENNNKILTCPHTTTINQLKEKHTFKIKTKQLVGGILGTILLVLSITFTVMKINDGFQTRNEKIQTEQIEKIIKILEDNHIIVE